MSKEQILDEMGKVKAKWQDLRKQLDAVEAEEHLAAQVRKFSDYKFKCMVEYGGTLSSEKREIGIEDIKRAKMSLGIPMVTYPGGMGGDDSAVFLKDDADHARAQKLFKALSLAHTASAPCGGNPDSVEAGKMRAALELYEMLK